MAMKNADQQENLVLAIAIDEYGELHGPLYNAKTDLDRFLKVMKERYNFELFCPLLENGKATRENILEEFEKLEPETTECKNLIIYFAGHGEVDEHTYLGYWVPIDAVKKKWSYISNSTVNDHIKGIRAKHVLLISDCCYSGTFISQYGIQEKIDARTSLTSDNSRWVLTSGEITKVSDGVKGEGSPFAQCLNAFLEDNKSHKLKMTSLFNEVIENTKGHKGQKPGAAPLKYFGGIAGEMTLQLANDAPKIYQEGKLDFEFPDINLPANYISRYITYGTAEDKEFSAFYAQETGRVYLEDIIKTQKKIVLLGGAGSGKSIELSRLALKLKHIDQPLTPILIRLNMFQEENLEDFLPLGWDQTDPASLVIFLDGLDEVQPEFFGQTARAIKDFFETNHQITAVVSCRTNFYENPFDDILGALSGFKAYFISEVTLEIVESILSRIHGIDAETFIAKIYDAQFLDLIQKPIFLKILISYYLENGDFSGGRGKIMEKSIVDQDKGFLRKTEADETNEVTLFSLLENIAFVMEMTGKNYLTDEDLHSIFPDQEEYLQCKTLPTFNYNKAKDNWSFEHNNIQEYLASRVLARQTFDKLQKLLFIESAGSKRVKPAWTNTLSFLISIDKGTTVTQLVDMILQEDREVIIKFETDRFDEQQRTDIFKNIFNFYVDKEIWVSSNKFSPADLVRFGRTKETLRYLKDILSNKDSSRIKKINTTYLLLYFDFKGFETEAMEFLSLLLDSLLEESHEPADIHRMMSLIARIPKVSDDNILKIIEKFKKHKNQYIRAGLYELIAVSALLEKYIDILLDGLFLNQLPDSIEDRENFSLGDEDYHWEAAMKKVTSANGLKSIFKILKDAPQKRLSVVHNHRETLEQLIKNAISSYDQDADIFQAVFDLAIVLAKEYEETSVEMLSHFFKKTVSNGRALSKISEIENDDEFYYLHNLIINLIDSDALSEWIEYSAKTNVNKKVLNFIHRYLWEQGNHVSLAQNFDAEVRQKLEIILVKPIAVQRPDIWGQRMINNFELLFRPDLIKIEIEKVFERLNRQEINQEDIRILSKDNRNDDGLYIHSICMIILRRFTHNNRIGNLSEIVSWVDYGLSFLGFRISQIHQQLKSYGHLKVEPAMLDFIRSWTVFKGDPLDAAWYFINRFKFGMPAEKILEFTLYYNFGWELGVRQPGGIETLESLVGLGPLLQRVEENIINPEVKGLAWLGNASYALRKKMRDTYPYIIQRLQESQEEEYRHEALLDFWFELTGDPEQLEIFITKVYSRSLRLKGIDILSTVPIHSIVLDDILVNDLENPENSYDERLTAANYLLKNGNSKGFDFLFKELLDHEEEAFDYRRNLFGFAFINDVKSLDRLIILLEMAKKSKYQGDIFNNLESKILEALKNIAGVSEENYKAIGAKIKDLINQQGQNITNWSNLHYFIVQLEEQNVGNKISGTDIENAIKEYNGLQ
jgi:hypothetical protein